MINAKIADLVSHLANDELTEDQVCEYLVKSTLASLGAEHTFISEITPRKTARARASFGVDQTQFADWQEFPLDWKLPVTDALVEKRIVWINSLPNWPDEYPLLAGVSYPPNMRTMIVVPISRAKCTVACLGITSSQILSPDEEIDIVLETIANVISLHIYRQTRERRKLESPNVSSLTDRQVQILVHIAEKRTNNDIADIMGYSESTIRQETIRIFEKLQVSGRNEARSYFLKSKKRFGLAE